MTTLTKENARQHCRTCLVKLSGTETEENTGHNTDELKDLLINITRNQELQQLITKYINEEGCEQLPEFPQNMCLDCYNKLHTFEKFRRRAQESASKLYAVLCDENTSKVEIEFEDDANKLTEEANRNDDLYKLMFEDTMLETESVMLGNAEISTLVRVEMHEPDPFEITTRTSMRDEIDESDFLCKDSEQSSSESTGNVPQGWNDNDSSGGESEPSREKVERTRTLRSGIKIITEAGTNNKKKAKKKRHTKKEMKELRRDEIEDADGKIKRRKRKCPQCNHRFALKISLDAHIRQVHEGCERPYQCDLCDKAYKHRRNLYTHIKEIHEAKVRSFICDYPDCDRVFTRFLSMHNHKRFMHMPAEKQMIYECEQCGATFKQKGNRNYHRRTVHATNENLRIKKILCEHCGKKFKRRCDVERHIRTVHMKLKPFKCQYCSECFAARKTRRHHECIHTGEKPYVCDICGKAYRQKHCLKAHRRSHDKQNPEALLTANLNRNYINVINTFLEPPQVACDRSGIVSMEQPDISNSTQNPSPAI